MGAVRAHPGLGCGYRCVFLWATLRAPAARARGVSRENLGGRDRRRGGERGRGSAGQRVVPRSHGRVLAALYSGRQLLCRRGPYGEPAETFRGHEGQRYSFPGAWRRDGSHRQRDGRRARAVFRSDPSGSRGVTGVAVLGSTGSVGESTLDVLARNSDRFRLVALAANRNAVKLAQQIRKWRPMYAALADEDATRQLRDLLGNSVPETRLLAGAEGV